MRIYEGRYSNKASDSIRKHYLKQIIANLRLISRDKEELLLCKFNRKKALRDAEGVNPMYMQASNVQIQRLSSGYAHKNNNSYQDLTRALRVAASSWKPISELTIYVKTDEIVRVGDTQSESSYFD